jgi:hypothetical protein
MKTVQARRDILLFLILVATGMAVLLKAYFDEDGFLSPDSATYLRLAQNLADGNGYHITAFVNLERQREFFGVWPIGYPTLIFLVSKVVSLGPFWASKALNILLVGLSLIILRSLFRETAHIYGLVFLCGASLNIFSYTWSEAPFIFGLLWLAHAACRFSKTRKNIYAVSMMGAALFLFLSRYVGALSFTYLGLLSLYFLYKKDYNAFFKVLLISVLGCAVMGAYLFYNYTETGYFTGMSRGQAGETGWGLVGDALTKVLYELNFVFKLQHDHKVLFVIALLLELIAGGYIYRVAKRETRTSSLASKGDRIVRTFLVIGFLYLASIITLKWFVEFADLKYRILAPGSLILYIALIRHIESRFQGTVFRTFAWILAGFAAVSFAVNVPLEIYESRYGEKEAIYYETLHRVEEKYGQLPRDSAVILANRHVLYLRPDIKKISLPRDVTMGYVLDNLSMLPNRDVYIEKSGEILRQRVHGSIVDFAAPYGDGELIKLR